MRRMQGVADQHHVPERPALVPDPRKIAPHRFVRNQPVAVQRGGKHLLADRLRLLDGLVGKAVALPGRQIALDQEGAHVGRVAVVMRVEGAEVGFDKGLRQRLEALCGAVPGELVGRIGQRGAEIAFESCGAPASSGRRPRRSGRNRSTGPPTGSRVVSRRDAGGADALPAGWSGARAGRSRRSRRRRSRRFRRADCSVMFFQLSIRGAIASTVSGSSARRNSSACSENTTPKPQVAPAGFCSNRSIRASGWRFFQR